MNLVEAMRDPELFGPHFRPHPEHGDTWMRWRVFLKALFGLPMEAAEVEVYRHHTGRTEPPTAPFKEAALVKGRRGGGSRILGLIAVYLACFKSYREHLAPGEVATIAVIAADRRQARVLFRYIAGALRGVEMLAEMVEEETSDRIVLSNGVEIEITTASFRATRGYTYAAVLLDEIAFFRSENSANPDVEIVNAVRPGLSTIPGAMLLLASSPYAKRGVLYSTFRRHFGKDGARVLVFRGATAEMNPSIDPAIIAEALEDDPAAASAEYLACFRDDIAGYVAREVVDACTVPGRYELPRITGNRHVAFTDPSGGSADSFTLAIAHREGSGGTSRALLDAVREVKPPFSPEATVEEFCADLKRYGISRVTGDRYAGEWPREQFRKHGIAYDLSDRPASDLYRDVLPLLNSGRVELLDHPKLAAQLCLLERRVARSGRDNISHPPGGHDDLAVAVAGALLACDARDLSVYDRFRVLAS